MHLARFFFNLRKQKLTEINRNKLKQQQQQLNNQTNKNKKRRQKVQRITSVHYPHKPYFHGLNSKQTNKATNTNDCVVYAANREETYRKLQLELYYRKGLKEAIPCPILVFFFQQ